MKRHLVGGAVRDMLMGVKSVDYDWVVVGSTPEEMLEKDFKQVGADFPVFLHPDTGEEHALARTETKTGKGYNGFTTSFSPEVTLEDDLSRRDLTINAISMQLLEETDFFIEGDEEHFAVYDLFGGQDDINAKVLRHVGPAFADDPVRVLRLARFRARFGPEWSVAQETKELVFKMGKAGVLAELTAERVWQEMSRALMEPYARLFFDTLLELNALHTIFPEIYALKSALENPQWHAEGDAFEHTMMVLDQAVMNGYSLTARVCALTHDFGKGLTPKHLLPSHKGHADTGVPVVEAFCLRLRVPKNIRVAAMKVCKYHMHMHLLNEMTPKKIVSLLDFMGDNTVDLVCLGVCDERGRIGYTDNSVAHVTQLTNMKIAYDNVKFADLQYAPTLKPTAIKNAFRHARIAAIRRLK